MNKAPFFQFRSKPLTLSLIPASHPPAICFQNGSASNCFSALHCYPSGPSHSHPSCRIFNSLLNWPLGFFSRICSLQSKLAPCYLIYYSPLRSFCSSHGLSLSAKHPLTSEPWYAMAPVSRASSPCICFLARIPVLSWLCCMPPVIRQVFPDHSTKNGKSPVLYSPLAQFFFF